MKHIYCILISSLIFISSYALPEYDEMTHYIFPEFTPGVILMKNGIRNDVLLNYNSLTEEMIFENKGKKKVIAWQKLGLIDTVFIKDRKFIALNNKFVELIYHSKWDLYVEHKCKVEEKGKPSGYGGTSKTSSNKTFSSIFTDGNIYELKLPNIYNIDPYINYWLKKNGSLNMFKNMRELKKLYKDKEVLFKAYLKKHRVKYNDQGCIIQLIEHLESN